VDRWQVLTGSRPGALEPVTTQSREGFETPITVSTDEPQIAVRALDAAGRPLATSRPVSTGR
jgi:hypothetical protein